MVKDERRPKGRPMRRLAFAITGAARGLRQRLAEQPGAVDAPSNGGMVLLQKTPPSHNGSRHRTRALVQTATRAGKVGGPLKAALKAATRSYARGLAAEWGILAVAGVLALAAFVVLTTGLITALNLLLGVPAGYFLTVLLYGLGAGALVMMAKRRQANGREEAREHVADARREVRHVTRPVRRAFGKETA